MAMLSRASKIAGPALAVIAMLGGQSMASGGEYRGTSEERAACAPDAFRLCVDHIPDAGKVELCLRQRNADLSAACRSVFERTGSAAASSAR
jgi:hypothetical protein